VGTLLTTKRNYQIGGRPFSANLTEVTAVTFQIDINPTNCNQNYSMKVLGALK